MIRGSVVLLGSLLAMCSRGVDACPVVTWQVTQSAGGTCPSQMSGGGGLAYDNMIKDVVAASNRRRLTVTEDCAAVNPSPSTASCVPVQHIPEKPETHRRRLGEDGCQQCSGADDDADDASYGHDDGDRRRLTYGYDTGYKGSYMTFTITAEVAPDEDPMNVIDTVESDLNAYFLDGRTSCHDWVTNAVALGEEFPEGSHVYFSQTAVDNDSVHISRPGDFLDHHYNSNSNVRIGVWVGGSVAFLAVALMTTYGVKSFRQQRTVSGGDDNADRQQVQVDGITLNPLSESVTQGTSSEMSQDDSSDKEV